MRHIFIIVSLLMATVAFGQANEDLADRLAEMERQGKEPKNTFD